MFQKKLTSRSRENLQTDGRMDVNKDGRTLLYRTLPAEAGGPAKTKALANEQFLK